MAACLLSLCLLSCLSLLLRLRVLCCVVVVVSNSLFGIYFSIIDRVGLAIRLEGGLGLPLYIFRELQGWPDLLCVFLHQCSYLHVHWSSNLLHFLAFEIAKPWNRRSSFPFFLFGCIFGAVISWSVLSFLHVHGSVVFIAIALAEGGRSYVIGFRWWCLLFVVVCHAHILGVRVSASTNSITMREVISISWSPASSSIFVFCSFSNSTLNRLFD